MPDGAGKGITVGIDGEGVGRMEGGTDIEGVRVGETDGTPNNCRVLLELEEYSSCRSLLSPPKPASSSSSSPRFLL